MKKLTLFLVAILSCFSTNLLAAFTQDALVDATFTRGTSLNSGTTTSVSLTANGWYLITSTGTSTYYLYNNNGTLAFTTTAPSGTDAETNAKYLFRVSGTTSGTVLSGYSSGTANQYVAYTSTNRTFTLSTTSSSLNYRYTTGSGANRKYFTSLNNSTYYLANNGANIKTSNTTRSALTFTPVTITPKTHTINFVASPVGSGTYAGVTSSERNKQISVTLTPSTGYELASYTVTDAGGNAVTVTNDKFTMPASDVTITANFVARAKVPTITPASGTFTAASKDITITNNETGATVYYTTDGTDPTTASASFTGTSKVLTINGTTTVKAMAVIAAKENSTVASATYTRILPSSSVAFSPTTGSVAVSATLPTSVSTAAGYDGTVTYTSNRTGMATVDASGKITGVAAGTATITATAPATANYAASTATFTVTVVNTISPEDRPYAIAPTASPTQYLNTTITKTETDGRECISVQNNNASPIKLTASTTLGNWKLQNYDDNKYVAVYQDANWSTVAQDAAYEWKIEGTNTNFGVVRNNSTKFLYAKNSYFYSNGDASNTGDKTFLLVPYYACTISDAIANGTVSAVITGNKTADGKYAMQGATVTLSNTPSAGYDFVSYSVTKANGEAVAVTDGKFTMPASDVKISATFAISFTATYFLPGTWNGWATTDAGVGFDKDNKLTLALGHNTTYNFKFYNSTSGTWSGVTTGTIITANDTKSFNAGENCQIQTTLAGDYVFTLSWDDITPVITVTYPSPTDTYYLPGTWNGWNTSDQAVKFSVEKRVTLALEANTTYSFKFYNHDYESYSGNAGTMTSANCTNWDFDADANCGIQTTIAGPYVFTYNWKGDVPVITALYPHSITINASHGTVKASSESAQFGTNIILTLKPDDGFMLKTITAVDGAGNAITVEGTGSVRDFVMPSSDVTITAVFEEALSVDNYYYIRNVSTDKYIRFLTSGYTESNSINATPLESDWENATYFTLGKSGDKYTIGDGNGQYLIVSTNYAWNTGHSTTSSLWTITPTGGLDSDGSAIYTIQSNKTGNNYLKFDGTNLYAYTDGAATYAAGSNYNAWVFVRADKEYKVVVTGLDNPTQGGVTYGGAEKHNGDTFNGVAVTSADLAAIAVDGYNAQISLSGTTITVNYTNYYTVSCDIYEGGVKWDGVEYYDGDKIYTTGKTASDFTGIAVSGYNAPTVTITGSTIVVTYAINMSGYTTSEVSEGWFLLYYPGKSAYVKDDGNTFVMASGPTKSEDFYNYLFHVTGSAGAYNIQSKLGNYFYLSNGGCSHVDHTPHNFTITQSGTRIEIKDNTTSAYAAGDAVGGKFLGSSTSVSYRLFKVQDTHALLMAEALVGNELFDLNGSAEIAIDNATPATTATISDVISNFSKTVADGGYTTAQKTVAIASLHAATSDPAYYNMPEGRYMLRNLEGMENTHNADCFLTSLTNPMGLAKEVVGYWSIWDFAKTDNGTYTIANEGNKNILTPTLTMTDDPNRNDGYLCYDESRGIQWRVGNANNTGNNTNEFVILPGVLRYGAERRHFAVFQPSTTPAEDKGSDKLHYRYLAMDFTGNNTYDTYYRADHVAKSASIALMDKEVFWQVIPVKPTNMTDEYGTIEGEGNMFIREINNLAGYVGGVVTLSNVSSVPSLNFIRQLADKTTTALVNGSDVSYDGTTYTGSDKGAKVYRRIIEKIHEIQTTPALQPFYQQLQPKDSIDHPFFLESLCSTRPGPSARLTENALGANKEKLQWVTDYKGAVTTGAGVFYVEKSAAATTYHYVKDGVDATATDNYYVLKNHNDNYLKKYVSTDTNPLWIRNTTTASDALQFVITPVVPGIWQIQDINMPKTGSGGSISDNDDVYLTVTDTEGGKSGTEYGLLHYRVSETTTLWRFVTSNVLKDIHLNGPVDGTYFGTFANDLNVTIDCSGNAEDLKVFYCSKAEREGPDLYVTFSPVDNHDGDHFELQGGIGYLLVSSKTPVTGLNYYAGIPEPQYDYTDILQPVPASGMSITAANQYDIFSLGYASTTTLLGYYFGMPVYGKGVGFYQFPAGTTLTAGKSYIERDKFVDRSSGSSSSVKGEVELAVEILLEEEDGTTSVFMPTADGGLVPIHKDGVYDLTGRRVEKPVRGIYISNGKKYICK